MIKIKKKIIKIVFIIISIFVIINCIYFFIKIRKNNNSKIEIGEETKEYYEENNYDIFSKYYLQAEQKVKEMTLDEKIGQLLLVHLPDKDAVETLKKYKFGGYIFFEKDFKDKTEQEVIEEIKNLQNASKIPLLIAVDEEGGSVVRISSNENLVKSRFKSPMELYQTGGFDLIKQDTIEKSRILNNLGINLNLAPVVDICTNQEDYIYKRTLGEGTKLTSEYAKIVINASKDTGVSYALKHFPGYGNNQDTHKQSSTDNRTYEDICTYDLPPFISGIEVGAEAVLISHNIVTSIDKDNPATFSKNIHDLLINELKFTGIIITDDLAMKAVSDDSEGTVKAILAGNDLIITKDYIHSIESVKRALEDGRIDVSTIDKLASRIIAWKYYKGMII